MSVAYDTTVSYTFGMLERLITLLTKGEKLSRVFGTDLRSLGPVHVCACGSQVFEALVSFEDYEICWYFLDGTCVSCGNIVKLPCPVDNPVQ